MIYKKIKLIFIVVVSLNILVTLILLFHETILSSLDNIIMPINQELCKSIPSSLVGKVRFKPDDSNSFDTIESDLKYLALRKGGQWSPPIQQQKPQQPQQLSLPTTKVAIIVPYRDRQINLELFLRYMHPFLSNQQIYYGIYLIEPVQNLTFNRAMLMNIGFVESQKDDDWDCFIFHDVDMLPENNQNLYQCHKETPKQMAIAISTYSYSTDGYFKEKYFGGVSAFTKEQFENINGFSNSYFGWGIEDDDSRLRVLNKYQTIKRLTPEVGRYFANCHKKQDRNPDRFLLYLNAMSRVESDGLNSLKYKRVKVEKTYLFTRIFVSYKNSRK